MEACGERAVTELPQTVRKGRGGRPAGEHPSLSQCESQAQHVCAGSHGRGLAWVPEGPLCCCPRDLPWPRTQGPRHYRTLPQSLGYEKRLKEGPFGGVGERRPAARVPPGEPELGSAVLLWTLGFCVSSGHVWLPLCECPRTPNRKILVKTDLFFSLRLYLGS